jgi:protein SCO1/2
MVSRRELLLGTDDTPAAPVAAARAAALRKKWDADHFGKLQVVTHEGERVDFYRGLLHNKVVLINMMYASCGGTCPLTTANLMRVHKLLGDRVGREIFFYSITLRAEFDTPMVLSDYARMHSVGAGWKFLTGAPKDIELLRLKLGFYDLDPKVDQDISKHTGMVRIGNDRFGRWAMSPSSAEPEQIMHTVRFIARG